MTVRAAPLGVFVVEDDSSRRSQLLQVLQHDGDVVIMGLASTATDALTQIGRTRPDVVVLDLHLADGGSRHVIEQLMARSPVPILILSALIDDRRSPSAVDALVAGALDALPRPASWTPELGAQLRHCVRQISKVPVIRHIRGNRPDTGPGNAPSRSGTQPVVAVAASTGGPSALATLLSGLPGLPAAVLVVQHLHPDFTAGLAEWMNRVSALPVEIAEQNQAVRTGRVYLAPGGVHLCLGVNQRVDLRTEPVSTHRPSADQLFGSVAHYGAAAIGVVLTGMGDDGARGLLAIHRSGGRTLGQDEASCAVFGMPRAAQRLGAVTDLLPLDQLAGAIQRAVRAVRA